MDITYLTCSLIFHIKRLASAVVLALMMIQASGTAVHQWDLHQDGAVIHVIEDSDSLLTRQSVLLAVAEFNALRYISPILLVAPVTNNNELQETDRDGYNTICMRKIGQPAYTLLQLTYNRVPYTLHEFDIVIDPEWVQTPEMLHLLLLHELGHVMGLEHPAQPADTVMGYVVQVNNGGIVQQETTLLHLTKIDIMNLYLHNIVFGTLNERGDREKEIAEFAADNAVANTLTQQRKEAYCRAN